MSFVEAVETCFKKYSDFSGRASRSEYWWFFLFNILIGVVASIANQFLFGTPQFPISTLVTLGLMLPGLAVGARRLHDINKSGWWQLLLIAGLFIIPIIYLLYLHSRPASYLGVCGSCNEEYNSDEDISFCNSCGEKLKTENHGN